MSLASIDRYGMLGPWGIFCATEVGTKHSGGLIG